MSEPSEPLSASGREVFKNTSVGAQRRADESAEEREQRRSKLTAAYRTILEELGEDPTREGLLKTPQRAADALLYLTQGYQTDLTALIHEAIFDEEHDEMVIVRDIDIFSLCEHHMLPFHGKVHIGTSPMTW